MAVTTVSDIHLGFRMHIKGYMVISIRYVNGDWATLNDFASSGNMPHRNNYESLNMHTSDMVCISRDSQ